MEEAVDAVEAAFGAWGRNEVQMPPKSYLIYDGHDGDLRSMPAYIPSSGATGVKIVTVHPNNPEIDLPTVMALTVLNDPKTGLPVAVMDATHLTAVRTGAGGAVASAWLAIPQAEEVGLVGAGVQARYQIEAHFCVRDIKRVVLFDPRREACESLAEWIADIRPGVDVEIGNLKEACDTDIIITTTPARQPVVWDQDIVRPHTHLNGIGADAEGKQEVDPLFLMRAHLVVDDWTQASHSGEINLPLAQELISREDIIAELGVLVANEDRSLQKELTLFDSTGLAIQDMATAQIVAIRAKERGIGLPLDPLS